MNTQPPTLLITDDDRAFRETLQSVFAPRGFATFLAADGEEAVEVIRNEQIHVALLDMHMPRLTGLEAVQAARQINAVIPFVLITAGLDETILKKAEQAEVFNVLEKPVELNVVTSVVGQAFQQAYDWAVI